MAGRRGRVSLTIETLRSNLKRFRKKDTARRVPATHAVPAQALQARKPDYPRPSASLAVPRSELPSRAAPGPGDEPSAPDDPMAIAREALNKPRFDIRKIHGDGDPRGQKLI
jgi:hypothetical protein